MADTAIWSTLSWPLANVVSARALIYDLVGIVPAFGPCFACSCDQKVRARLFVSSHRYFYKVQTLDGRGEQIARANSSRETRRYNLISLCKQ